MNLYEELGRIQYQIDKLEVAKDSIARQIEIQRTIETIRQQAADEAKPLEDSDASKSPA